MITRRPRILLLDFGGVCLLNPAEMHARLEQRLGLPSGTFTWLGPLDPTTDDLWRRMVAGEGPTEREYWAIRAREVGEAIGSSFTTRDLMRLLYEPVTDDLIRPGCRRVVEAALGAGWNVSVLSNDLGAFHGPEWAASVPLLGLVDHVLDCSDGPALKPHRAAYEWALLRLGAPADAVVFVDDQPGNVDGARACGIEAIWFDIADAEHSWRSIGERIGVDR